MEGDSISSINIDLGRALKAGDVIEVSLTDKKGNVSAVSKTRVNPKGAPEIEDIKAGDKKATATVPKNSIISVEINGKNAQIGTVSIRGDKLTVNYHKGFSVGDTLQITAKIDGEEPKISKVAVIE